MEIPSSLMDKYLERRKEDLLHCQTLLERLEFKSIEKIGHQLKGNGATFGFPEVSKIGSTLEMNASRLDPRGVKQVLLWFSTWLNNRN